MTIFIYFKPNLNCVKLELGLCWGFDSLLSVSIWSEILFSWNWILNWTESNLIFPYQVWSPKADLSTLWVEFGMNLFFPSYSFIFIPLVFCKEYNERDPIADDELSVFPVCTTDADCRNISQQASADYRCFQYRCFPWNNLQLQRNFRSCRNNPDCSSLGLGENGDGQDGLCFRHLTLKQVGETTHPVFMSRIDFS